MTNETNDTYLKEFTVDRETWYRGKGAQHSALLRPDGQMCCLGHYCLASGVHKTHILNISAPSGLVESKSSYLSKIEPLIKEDDDIYSRFKNSEVCQVLMTTNDNSMINDVTRESILTEKFAEIGITVHFEN